jgi:hypothetical protein
MMRRMLLPVLVTPLVLLLAGCSQPDILWPQVTSAIEKTLVAQELQICARGQVNWTNIAASRGGRTYDLARSCAGYDPQNPGARLSVTVFTKAAARDAAQSTLESGRSPTEPAMIWSKGPVLVTLAGPQSSELEQSVRRALETAELQ